MNILLVNPPNSGRSIPEERYSITSLRQTFRGEPLALEVIAGNLDGHEVGLVDLKAEPEGLEPALADIEPDLVGFTSMTCEANSVRRMAARVKELTNAKVAVGGIHATLDPEFFNFPHVDFVLTGLGKGSFRKLADGLAVGGPHPIDGVGVTTGKGRMRITPRVCGSADLAEDKPPRYDLVEHYRDRYKLEQLGVELGHVVTAYGCTHRCSFCCIPPLTGGKYLTHGLQTVVRDAGLVPSPLVRLVDANTFGDPAQAGKLADAIAVSDLDKSYIADVRADTVVSHPDLLAKWKRVGLRSAVIGFEEIDDDALDDWSKRSTGRVNEEAIEILHGLGISIVGDFIVSPDYTEAQFDRLGGYIEDRGIELPMLTVLTPLPGTVLYEKMRDRIVVDDLDYYTLTNAVTKTRLDEDVFYRRFSDLVISAHARGRI